MIVPQGTPEGEAGKATISFNRDATPVTADETFIYDSTAHTILITLVDTTLKTYSSTDGALAISFNVKASTAQDVSVLSAPTTIKLELVSDTEAPIIDNISNAGNITGALPIANVAVAVALTSPHASHFIFNNGTINYTITITHVTGGAAATIANGTQILAAPTGVAFTPSTDENFTVTATQITAAKELTISSTTGEDSYTVTVTGTYTSE